MHYASRTPFVMDEKIGVIFELLSGTEYREVSAQLIDFQSRDIPRKVVDMGANIAETTSGSSFTRIVSPDLARGASLQWVRQPALRILGDDFENLAQFSATNCFARLFHHWIACVTVRQREHLP